jgi:hypothetical protein
MSAGVGVVVVGSSSRGKQQRSEKQKVNYYINLLGTLADPVKKKRVLMYINGWVSRNNLRKVHFPFHAVSEITFEYPHADGEQQGMQRQQQAADGGCATLFKPVFCGLISQGPFDEFESAEDWPKAPEPHYPEFS